jgi:uncharacterized protein
VEGYSLDVKCEIIEHGFPRERAKLIHALVGGSQLHGVKLEGADDRDLYGIYIERPNQALWHGLEHFVTSTSPQSERNKPGDVDVICYSLRKFARLAVTGNPTILHMLFTPGDFGEEEWSEVLGSRHLFLAKAHARRYEGYANAQLHRMMGLAGRGKHGQRPELEEKYGFDTKAGMHVLRLLHEGIELVRCGWVTLPRPEPERSTLLEVRRGEWSQERVIAEANRLFSDLAAAVERSTLPEHPDINAVRELVTQIYLRSWGRWGWAE